MKTDYGFATLAVHAGQSPCPVTGAVDTPIYQATTFAAADAEEMAAVYGGEKPGYMYTRYGNPTLHALEEKLAALECGDAAQVFSSGMAAVSSAILGYVRGGRSHRRGALALRSRVRFPCQDASLVRCRDHLCSIYACRGI